jgi:hypothetical protein
LALFKPLLGKRARLPETLTNGWAYFCTDDGSFWIDYADSDGVVKRKQINAQEAEKLIGYEVVADVTNDSTLIPTSSAVYSAIEAATEVYVGPDRPTDPNIKVWINTAEEGTGVVPMLPRITTITLSAASWTGSSNPWSQGVEITADANIGISSKLDPQPTAQQIVSMQNEETSIMLSNEGGYVVAYAIGNKPTVDYTMQVLITEVAFV